MPADIETTHLLIVGRPDRSEHIDRQLRQLLTSSSVYCQQFNDVSSLLFFGQLDVVVVTDKSSLTGIKDFLSAAAQQHCHPAIVLLLEQREMNLAHTFFEQGVSLVCPSSDIKTLAHYIKLLSRQKRSANDHGKNNTTDELPTVPSKNDFTDNFTNHFTGNTTTANDNVKQIDITASDRAILNQMAYAIKKSAVEVKFQPVVNFTPTDTTHYTALVHLLDEQGNRLADYKINPVINRLQCTAQFDRTVLSSLFKKLRAVEYQPSKQISLFVPIHARSLQQTGFVAWVKKAITSLNHPTNRCHFIFQLTFDDIQTLKPDQLSALQTIRSLGTDFAVAQVQGSILGFEQLFQLVQPAFIKVDMREIDGLEKADIEAILKPLTTLSAQLKATVVADHLGSAAQLALIWPYAVRMAQGRNFLPALTQMDFDFKPFALPPQAGNFVSKA